MRCLVYDADTVLRASYLVPVTRRARQAWQELTLAADIPTAGFVQVLFGNEGRLPVLADDLTLTLTAPPLAPALVLHGGLASAFAVQETGGCTGHGPHPGDPVSPGMPCGDDPNAPCGSFPLGNVGVTGHHPDPPSHGNPDPPQLDPPQPEPEPASDPCLDGTGDMCLCDPGSCDPPSTDCAGVVNGGAYLDKCYTCVGGTTGRTACTGCGPAGVVNVRVQDGAPVAHADKLENKFNIVTREGQFGATAPTSLECQLTACLEEGVWKTRVSAIVGHYWVQAHNPAGVAEVRGVVPPIGNTTKENHCAQVGDLLRHVDPSTTWWMVDATRAHEAVHEAHLYPLLAQLAPALQAELEQLTLAAYLATSEAQAVFAIRNSYECQILIKNAFDNWANNFKLLEDSDHAGPTTAAAETVTLPMVTTICEHAQATRPATAQSPPTPDPWPYCNWCP